MQVNRFSFGLQEALKSATNFNTARSETLFDAGLYGNNGENGEEIDFSTLNIEDLNITEEKIAALFSMFQDEIIAIFGSNLPFMQPPKNNDPNNKDNAGEPANENSPVDGANDSPQGAGQPTVTYTA